MTTAARSVRTVDLEGPPPAGTVLEVVGPPSLMPWRDAYLAGRLAALEQLPPVERRREVRAAIREREAELAIAAELHPRPELADRRVDDEELGGLYLIELLLCT